MKYIIALVLFFGVGSSPYKDICVEVAACIRAGNAKDLSEYFSNHVDLTVLGREEMYSKAHAEQVLRDFFAKHPPRSFILKHRSPNPSASQYGIGTYTSRNNVRFRVYFLVRKIGNQSFIQQMSIEHEKDTP